MVELIWNYASEKHFREEKHEKKGAIIPLRVWLPAKREVELWPPKIDEKSWFEYHEKYALNVLYTSEIKPTTNPVITQLTHQKPPTPLKF